MKIATFSIVAHDPAEHAWGIAVASKFPAVGAVVPWARAEAGAVATQSYANTTFGPLGLALMQEGLSAREAVDRLIEDDDQRALRQLGMVDARGTAATYTGEGCYEWAGGLTGPSFCCQGNILSGSQVIESMAAAYQETVGDFPGRLVSALLAGDRAGGDRRGRQSAAILAVKTGGGYGGFNDRWLDYRVDDHVDPVPELEKLLGLHHLYFGASEPEDQLAIEGEVARTLQAIMVQLAYYAGEVNGVYDGETRRSLREFLGNENFEDRTDFEQGRIDRPVLEYLVNKFGGEPG
jgi:uncharacterized Ntn-hydrolase superfamily protein